MKIYEIQKNSLEKIIFETSEYQGKKYFSIRIYYDASKGQDQDWKPTPRGITISIDLLKELKEGVDKANELLPELIGELWTAQEKP